MWLQNWHVTLLGLSESVSHHVNACLSLQLCSGCVSFVYVKKKIVCSFHLVQQRKTERLYHFVINFVGKIEIFKVLNVYILHLYASSTYAVCGRCE